MTGKQMQDGRRRRSFSGWQTGSADRSRRQEGLIPTSRNIGTIVESPLAHDRRYQQSEIQRTWVLFVRKVAGG